LAVTPVVEVPGGAPRRSRRVEVAILFTTLRMWKRGGRSRGRILSLTLLGGLGLTASVGEQVRGTHAAPHAAQTWLAVQGSWLCRPWTPTASLGTVPSNSAVQETHWQGGKGWFGVADNATGTTIHCTLRWHASADGHLISDMPAWVPNPTGVWPASEGH